jgi:hypothetical protein
MIDLNALAAELTQKRTVTLRGHVIAYTLVDGQTARRVREAMVRPEPRKMRKDPTRGSLASPIPDETDPEYLADLARWQRMVQACEIAVCLMRGGSVAGLPDEPDWDSDAEIRRFASEADGSIRRAFGAGEIATLAMLVYSTDPATPAEDAEGN